MFPANKAVKSTALNNLKGNWVKCSCAALIPVVMIFILILAGNMAYYQIPLDFSKYIIAFSGVLSVIFVANPVFLGTLRFFKNFAQDKSTLIGETFTYFSSFEDYFRAVEFSLRIFVRTFLVGFLFLLPSFITDLAYHGELDVFFNNVTPLWFNDLWVVSIFLRVLAIVLIFAVLLKYYLSPFIFVGNDSVSPLEAIRLSVCASKISGLPFLGLALSQIFWIIISVLLIPLVFTMPYLISCYVSHCGFAVYHYNKSLKMKNSKEAFDPDFDI